MPTFFVNVWKINKNLLGIFVNFGYIYYIKVSRENEMKVTYNADTCSHAGECVKGAPNVFKVVDGQFVIDTSADSEDNIRSTVANCPSGALKIEE